MSCSVLCRFRCFLLTTLEERRTDLIMGSKSLKSMSTLGWYLWLPLSFNWSGYNLLFSPSWVTSRSPSVCWTLRSSRKLLPTWSIDLSKAIGFNSLISYFDTVPLWKPWDCASLCDFKLCWLLWICLTNYDPRINRDIWSWLTLFKSDLAVIACLIASLTEPSP